MFRVVNVNENRITHTCVCTANVAVAASFHTLFQTSSVVYAFQSRYLFLREFAHSNSSYLKISCITAVEADIGIEFLGEICPNRVILLGSHRTLSAGEQRINRVTTHLGELWFLFYVVKKKDAGYKMDAHFSFPPLSCTLSPKLNSLDV